MIGFSGTGKYTVARALSEQVSITIIDNQLINTPIFAAIGADGKKSLPSSVWREVRRVRDAVLDAVLYIASPDTNFVFTNELLARSKGDEKLFQEIEGIAEARKAILVPVRLLCSREEHLKRITNPDRKARYKAMNAEEMAIRLDTIEVLKPDHPHLLELDITSMTPHDAASKILHHINQRIISDYAQSSDSR